MNLTIYALIGAVVVALGSFGYAQWERADRIHAEAQLEAAQTLLRNNQQALKRLTDERNTTVAALEQVTATLQSTSESLRDARRVVYASPRTNSCVALPGVRALRDSLRVRAAGNPSSGAQAAR